MDNIALNEFSKNYALCVENIDEGWMNHAKISFWRKLCINPIEEGFMIIVAYPY